jgi:hypothetical protein
MCAPDNIVANTDLICCAVLATDFPPDEVVAFLHNVGLAARHLQVDFGRMRNCVKSLCKTTRLFGQGKMLPSQVAARAAMCPRHGPPIKGTAAGDP